MPTILCPAVLPEEATPSSAHTASAHPSHSHHHNFHHTIGDSARFFTHTSSSPPGSQAHLHIAKPLSTSAFPEDSAAAVGLHVYDLSNGFVAKNGSLFLEDLPSVMRDRVQGIYHSALVFQGREYYFEGGIATAAKGSTRFGKVFQYVFLGKTDCSEQTFSHWLRAREHDRFQMAHYHPIHNNCHHFTKDAAGFLLTNERWQGVAEGLHQCSSFHKAHHSHALAANTTSTSTLHKVHGEPWDALPAVDSYPSFLFDSIDCLLQSSVGKLVVPLLARFTGGVQRIVNEQLLHHDEQRRLTDAVVTKVCDMCHSHQERPPRAIILFSCTPAVASKKIADLMTMEYPEEGCKIVCNDWVLVMQLTNAILDGAVSLDEFEVQRFVTVLESLLEAHPRHSWGPLFDGWRCALAHKSLHLALVYSEKLNNTLLRAAWCFQELLDSVKVDYLRVLCNLAAAPHGAALLIDGRRIHQWVTVIGLALGTEACPHVMELGAALCLNVITSMVVMQKTSLDKEVKHHGESHAAYRLLTIILYFLQYPVTPSETVVHWLLLSLFLLESTSAEVTSYAMEHALRLDASSLNARLQSDESRSLLRMISVIEDLCCSDSEDADDGVITSIDCGSPLSATVVAITS